MPHPNKITFAALPWESPMPGVRFKRYAAGGKQLRLVEYTREFAEPDWCGKGHTGYVIDGELEIDFHGTVVLYSPGDAIPTPKDGGSAVRRQGCRSRLIPPGEGDRHKAKILTDTATVFLSEDV